HRTEEVLRYKDYAAYYRSVKRRFEETIFSPQSPLADVDSPSPLLGGQGGGISAITTHPDPVDHCDICRWIDVCKVRRRQDDHLCLVAGMRRDQTRLLQAVGITTVAELGASPIGQPVAGIGDPALERLRQQARLQVTQRQTDNPTYEVLAPLGARLGFEALPPPSPADLFFDIEGDPFVGDGGLEYLFGVLEMVDGAPRYHDFWGHDPDAEKRAFEQLVDFLIERLDGSPDLHIYPYASYEPNVLKELSSTYATREQEVDRLLRGGVLVDLYRVVRQSVRVSLESYSLKELEAFYRGKRTTAIVDAAGSLVAYEDWLHSREQWRLDDIAHYNEDDCRSTSQLREEKSEWWEYFRKCSLTDEQLVEDRESIGGLEFRGEVRQERQSNIFRYHFDPVQEYKVGVGDQPEDPRSQGRAGLVVALDP